MLAAITAALLRLTKSVFGSRSVSFASMLSTASPTAAFAGGVPSAATTTDSISGRALTSSVGPSSMIPSTIGWATASRRRSSSSADFVLVGQPFRLEELLPGVEQESTDERERRAEHGEQDREAPATGRLRGNGIHET